MMDRSRSSHTDIIAEFQRKIKSLEQDVEVLRGRDQPAVGWIPMIGYTNGWANSGAPNINDGAYWKDSAGIVHLRGRLVGANLNSIFVLPIGYRPGGKEDDVPTYHPINANGAFGLLQVSVSGDIRLFVGSPTYIDLDSAHFRAEG